MNEEQEMRPSLDFTVSVPSNGFSGIHLKSTRIVSSWCHGSVWCPEPRKGGSGMIFATSPNSNNVITGVEIEHRPEVLRGPHTPLDWFVLNYDSHFCPPFLFKFSIEWLVCSSLFICRLVRRMRVMAACYGFTLVDLPIAQLVSTIPTPESRRSDSPARCSHILSKIDTHNCRLLKKKRRFERSSIFCNNGSTSSPSMDERTGQYLSHSASHIERSENTQWNIHAHRLLPFHPPWNINLTPSKYHADDPFNSCCCSSCDRYHELEFYRSLLNSLLSDSDMQLLILCHREQLGRDVVEGRGLADSIDPGWLLIERHGLFFVHICR